MEENPTLNLYQYNNKEGYINEHPAEKLELTHEFGNNYIFTEVMLLGRNSGARDRCIQCKRDAEGISIVISNYNTILGNRWYEFEFADGELAKLTSNVMCVELCPLINILTW